MTLMNHSLIIPIIFPLAVGAVMLFFDDRWRAFKAAITLATTILLVICSALLVWRAIDAAPEAETYLLGHWQAPFGIVLVLDQLAALMVLLASIIGLFSVLYARAHWQQSGQNFYALILFIMAGINGAVLTGDLFNLFVFFEIFLTASYALALHNCGQLRLRRALHYIVVNLVASSFFLIGAALLYGVTGTLNMAHLASLLNEIDGNQLITLKIAGAFLGLAFLTKAAIWPLNFWLVPLYSVLPAPIGAIFTLLSKIGIYVVLRFTMLLANTEALVGFVVHIVSLAGLATLLFAMLGILASQTLGRLAAYNVLLSSATLLAVFASQEPLLITAGLYYMLSSTLALSVFFLLIAPLERLHGPAGPVIAVSEEIYGNDGAQDYDVGTYLPATLAILGACFAICALLLIGMPPLSGFIGKLMIIEQLLQRPAPLTNPHSSFEYRSLLICLILASSLVSLIALSRMGIRIFWSPMNRDVGQLLVGEFAPIAGLLALSLMLTLLAGPISRYLTTTADELRQPNFYIESVLKLAKEAK